MSSLDVAIKTTEPVRIAEATGTAPHGAPVVRTVQRKAGTPRGVAKFANNLAGVTSVGAAGFEPATPAV